MTPTDYGFRSPMLATAVAAKALPPGTWIAEEKFDGHRLIVAVYEGKNVIAWSRHGKVRPLADHLFNALCELPSGIYDGELVMRTGKSYNVRELENQKLLTYMVFDLLGTGDSAFEDWTQKRWSERRARLTEIFIQHGVPGVLELTDYINVSTWEGVMTVVDAIWAEGGEGAILKDVNAIYRVGKRSKSFLKVKALQSALLTIVGFSPSEGEIQNRGKHGMTVLQDPELNYTVVKTLNNAELARLDHAYGDPSLGPADVWQTVRLPGGTKVKMQIHHPFVGKQLWIEFQERTPDGSYRHPRWDHLDGE